MYNSSKGVKRVKRVNFYTIYPFVTFCTPRFKFGFVGLFDERCVPCFSLAGDHMGSPLQIALK